jgi:hypothetical protein
LHVPHVFSTVEQFSLFNEGQFGAFAHDTRFNIELLIAIVCFDASRLTACEAAASDAATFLLKSSEDITSIVTWTSLVAMA